MFYLMLVFRVKGEEAKNHSWLTACGQVGPDVVSVRNVRTSNARNVIVQNSICGSYVITF
jgi:hypothetical protein